MADWHARFLNLAAHIATWSKDPSTKVGAVAVGPDREIRATGFNGFPRGVDDCDSRFERPLKYAFTAHAEANCIYQAARIGTSLHGCSLYVTHPPCSECAKAIIQAGIAEVFCPSPDDEFLARWKESMAVSDAMFSEAGIILRFG